MATCRGRGARLAEDFHAAGGRAIRVEEAADQRRLARAVHADESEAGAGRHVETHVAERDGGAEGFSDGLEPQRRRVGGADDHAAGGRLGEGRPDGIGITEPSQDERVGVFRTRQEAMPRASITIGPASNFITP